jgi:hypothetical protein
MQNMLDVFTDYCKQWKLYVNIDKTKVVVFSKRRCEAGSIQNSCLKIE